LNEEGSRVCERLRRPAGGRRGMGSGGVKPAAAMVAVEFIFSALQIFIKLALDDGMDVRVLVAYRLMFGTGVPPYSARSSSSSSGMYVAEQSSVARIKS
jgi:hypothetical protein